MSVRVLIAEDDHELRGLFKSHVQTIPGLEVVGHATDGRGAISLCDELHPELILIGVDDDLGPINESIREVRESCPEIKVVAVTSPHLASASIDGADVVLHRPMGSDTFSSALLELIDEAVR